MIRALTIENFRCFETFELHDLGRVNLLVGGNNSGKTSVLEAVELVTANGDVAVLERIQLRRSEDVIDRHEIITPSDHTLAVRHLFHGHQIGVGRRFSLTTQSNSVRAEVVEVKVRTGLPLNGDEPTVTYPVRQLELLWSASPNRAAIRLERGDTVNVGRARIAPIASDSSTVFLSAMSLVPVEAVELFSHISLRPEEELVHEAIKAIEPSVQRIGIQIERINRLGFGGRRGGFNVLLSTSTEPVPIGSIGEGFWRLLCLALCLVRAKDGILLIDEIDTGLHYSVMEKMWKLVTETAKRLNIQVFATTHSRDCVESLASVCRESVTDASEVTIQRIERGKKRSVAYTEQEIIRAAEYGTEVR